MPARKKRPCARWASRYAIRYTPELALLPEFVDRSEPVLLVGWNVLEPAVERIVAPHRGPVDAQRRVNRRFDVLGLHLALLRPARIGDHRAAGIGGTDGSH